MHELDVKCMDRSWPIDQVVKCNKCSHTISIKQWKAKIIKI